MWRILPALLFFLLILVFFRELDAPQRIEPARETALRHAPPLEAEPLEAGTPAPPLEEVSAPFVLINFFASWCVPCRAEHPLLHRLAGRSDLALYGIGWNDAAAPLREYLRAHGNPYRYAVRDAEGKTAVAYGITGVPESFLLDARRRILFHHRGPLTEELLRERILPALK
jgi:cytochrome c biogenesis protein CcmG/thiol:disulfide interchange protein DsbE